MTSGILDKKDIYEQEILRIPLRRIGKAADIASATLFLVSEAADFI